MTLKQINAEIGRAKRKLVRAATGLETCARRIKHHKRQWHHYDKTGQRAKARRAKENLRRWQKRQTVLQRKHKYLQLVLHRRYRAKAKWLEAHPDRFPPAPGGGDWVTFDGHEVAKWIAEILQAARDKGYWNGYVISGRRSPEYSRELCENMCGAPQCPGRCAGTSSNHAGPPSFKGVPYEGAVDVSDWTGLRRYCERYAPQLRGGGAVLGSADLPHFSHAGN